MDKRNQSSPEIDRALDGWTARLLELAPGADRAAARSLLAEVYQDAQLRGVDAYEAQEAQALADREE